MRIDAANAGQFDAITQAVGAHIADAAGKAVDDAAMSVRDELRAQTRTALGPKLERAWTFRRYHKAGDRIDEAALVYSKAPRIIEAFSTDTVIVARNARWLVLPLDAAKAAGLDKTNARHWSNVAGAIDALKLAFVPLPGNRALLVRKVRGGKPVPYFLLVKRVSLKQRLDLTGEAGKAADHLRNAFLKDL